MSRSLGLFIVLVMMLTTAGILSAQTVETPRTAWPAYVFTLFIGFGTGQYYLGESGTGFLIGDLTGLACMAGGYFYMMASLLNPATFDPYDPYPDSIFTGYAIVGIGGAVYLVSRIWEIVNVFSTSEKMRSEGRVVGLFPELELRPGAASFEVSYRY